MRPKNADRIANTAVWSGSALFAQTYLSENLGSLQYMSWIHWLLELQMLFLRYDDSDMQEKQLFIRLLSTFLEASK